MKKKPAKTKTPTWLDEQFKADKKYLEEQEYKKKIEDWIEEDKKIKEHILKMKDHTKYVNEWLERYYQDIEEKVNKLHINSRECIIEETLPWEHIEWELN